MRAPSMTRLTDASTDWVVKDGRINAVIPANSGATLRVPRTHLADITENRRPIGGGNGRDSARQDAEDTVLESKQASTTLRP